MNALIRPAVSHGCDAKRVPFRTTAGTVTRSSAGTARAAVVLVGGHEGGGSVAVAPSAERGLLIRSSSARRELDVAVRRALESTDLPVCVVPMTLGRDPRLVADSARTLTTVAGGVGAGRVVLADPFGTATLLTGWLRVAVAQAVDPFRVADTAVVLTAKAANRFDDADLFRIAHLVKVRANLASVEVGLDGGDPEPADVLDRCELLGARRFAVIPADFRPLTSLPTPGVAYGGPLLSPAAVSGVLASRIATALLKLSRGDDGIGAGLDADHDRGHGGSA